MLTSDGRVDRVASMKETFPDDTDDSSVPSDVEAKTVIVGAEGDLQGWLTVLGSCLVYFSTFGIINSFGFFQNYYSSHALSSVSPSTISLVGTIQITLMNLLAAPAGSLFDCLGLKILYIGSGIVCSGALICLSFVKQDPTSLWQIFLIQGVFLGTAIGFGSQPALAVVGQHFERHRGLVMGLVASAGSVGGVCFPLIFARLEKDSSLGFAWALRVVAAIVAICFAIAVHISHVKYSRKALESTRQFFDFGGFRKLSYSILAVGAFLAMLGQFIPYYYIGTYMAIANPNFHAQDYLLPLMNAASILGRLLGGLAADAAGPANTIYPMTIFSGLLCLGTWAITSNIPVIVSFILLYGFCSGVFIAVLPVNIARLTADPTRLGGRIGAFYSVCAIAQLVGSPIGGALIGARDGGASAYVGLIVFAGTTLLGGGMVIFMSRLVQDKNVRARL